MTTHNQARGLLESVDGTRRAPWVAVAGGKGGVGKTLLAVNLALQLQRAGHRTLLVDLDPGLGNVDVHLRLASVFTVEDVANGECTLAQALLTGPAGLKVLAGRSGSTALASGDPVFLDQVLSTVAAASTTVDVVVCDTGAGIGPAVLGVACRADLVLGVTTPDPAALTDTYALCKVLNARGRPLPRLVVNRVHNREQAMRTASKLTTVCRKFLDCDSKLLGWLVNDSLLELSVQEQRPFVLHGTGPALDDLRSLCAAVLATLPALQRRRHLPPPLRVVNLRPGSR